MNNEYKQKRDNIVRKYGHWITGGVSPEHQLNDEQVKSAIDELVAEEVLEARIDEIDKLIDMRHQAGGNITDKQVIDRIHTITSEPKNETPISKFKRPKNDIQVIKGLRQLPGAPTTLSKENTDERD